MPHALDNHRPKQSATIVRLGVVAAFLLIPRSSLQLQAQSSLPFPAADFPLLVERATQLSEEGKPVEARAAWRRVVALNPYDGRSFYLLAQSEVAAGDTSAAIEALERYVILGGSRPDQATVFGADTPGGAAYQLARLHALRKEPAAALRELRRALALRYRNRTRIGADTAFQHLRNSRSFQELAGITPPGLSRQEGWAFDIRFLLEELERFGPPEAGKLTQEHGTAAADLIGRVRSMSDAQVVVGLERILRASNSGHTSVLAEGVIPWQGTIPVQFEAFGDSTVIIASDSAHAAVVGTRVIAIDGHSAGRVAEQLDSLVHGDNSFGRLKNRLRFLRYPRILNALGIISKSDEMTLSIRDESGPRTVTLRAQRDPPGYSRIAGHPSWVTVFSRTPGDPLFLRDRLTPYWFTYVAADRIIYFGYNSVVDDSRDPWDAFTQRLFRFIDTTDIDKVIVDLRWNNGGNTRLLPPLVQGLMRSKINRPGHLFVVTSKYTFSAAMNAAAFLERETNAIVVGEPTASQPNFNGESNQIVLPYSRVPVSVSDIYWQSSWPFDHRRWIAPTLYTPITLEDLKRKRDPALAAILAYPPTRP